LVLRLRGGGGKKKKKNKREKIALCVLKYYSVDDEGKIERLSYNYINKNDWFVYFLRFFHVK